MARRPEGFTLLEATVALVLFAVAGMALYSLFNTNLMSLGKARDVFAQLPAAHRAIEHLASINPRAEPTGEIELDGFDVRWTSRLLEDVRQSQTTGGDMGYFELGLFEVEFEVRGGGRSLGVHRLRLVGYEKVREPPSLGAALE